MLPVRRIWMASSLLASPEVPLILPSPRQPCQPKVCTCVRYWIDPETGFVGSVIQMPSRRLAWPKVPLAWPLALHDWFP